MRAQVGHETRVDLALDLLLNWIPQLRGEQVGVVAFDHRLLMSLPVAPQVKTQRCLFELSNYTSKPLDYDCTIDTPDELWSRVMFFLEWSGRALSSQLSDGFLRDLHDAHLMSSLLTTNSYRLDFASAYIRQVQLPPELPDTPLDQLTTHDQLRRFCHMIGVTMTPQLPRSPQELSQGLQEVLRYAQQQRATHLVFLSHSHRLSSHKELRALSRWAREKGGVSWVQVGSQGHKMPNIFRKVTAPMNYIPLYKSDVEDREFSVDVGPWQWSETSVG